jgi:hypothetical protein
VSVEGSLGEGVGATSVLFPVSLPEEVPESEVLGVVVEEPALPELVDPLEPLDPLELLEFPELLELVEPELLVESLY